LLNKKMPSLVSRGWNLETVEHSDLVWDKSLPAATE
jgi:hypothetical protein